MAKTQFNQGRFRGNPVQKIIGENKKAKVCSMNYERAEIIDGIEYRLVTICGRPKLIARDGQALNLIRRNQPCTTYLSKDGYPCFGGGIPVHLYVAYGWVDGYFDGAEVNHKDFDRTNYNADNLEWMLHINNVHYSSNENRYARQYGETNPNYHNDTLKKKYENNPDLKKCLSRPGIQNGRASHIYVYDLDMNFIKEFDLIKDCAKWLCSLFNKSEDKIPHIQSAISMAIKLDRPYKGFILKK